MEAEGEPTNHGSPAGRAFGATSLEEEKKLILEKALALATETEANMREHLLTEFGIEFMQGSTELRSDRSTVWAIMDARISPLSLMWASDELQNDRDLVLRAVQADGHALEHASPELQKDREVVLAAIRQNWYSMIHTTDELRGDREVVEVALQQCPLAFEYASPELRSERDLAMKALEMQTREEFQFQHIGSAFRVTGKNLRGDRELVLLAVRYEGCVLDKASDELRRDKDFVLQAVRAAKHPQACWKKAHSSVKGSWTEFCQVASSALACPGETAPVLSVSLTEGHVGNIASCTVSLLSGATFVCPVQPAPPDFDLRAAREADRQETTRPELTLNDLATQLCSEIPKHSEVERPERVFLVFNKRDGDSVTATPWDHAQALANFL